LFGDDDPSHQVREERVVPWQKAPTAIHDAALSRRNAHYPLVEIGCCDSIQDPRHLVWLGAAAGADQLSNEPINGTAASFA
jgi:hypothetical protein